MNVVHTPAFHTLPLVEKRRKDPVFKTRMDPFIQGISIPHRARNELDWGKHKPYHTDWRPISGVQLEATIGGQRSLWYCGVSVSSPSEKSGAAIPERLPEIWCRTCEESGRFPWALMVGILRITTGCCHLCYPWVLHTWGITMVQYRRGRDPCRDLPMGLIPKGWQWTIANSEL